MLCPDCNTYAAEDDIVCPRCGKLLDRQPTEEEELMRSCTYAYQYPANLVLKSFREEKKDRK